MKNKRDIQTEQQIIFNIVKILESFPQYSVSQHMWHIMRNKGGQDAYSWDNITFLAKIEAYYTELNNELVTNETEE